MNSTDSPHGELLAKIQQALTHVHDLASGKAKWRMCVPARPGEDSDLVLADALEGARMVLSEIGAQTNAAAQAAGFSPGEVPATAPLPQPAAAAPSGDKSETPRTYKAPKRLWLPAADWKTFGQDTAPWIRASWANDAWKHGVEYIRKDIAQRELNAARSATGETLLKDLAKAAGWVGVSSPSRYLRRYIARNEQLAKRGATDSRSDK